MVEIITERLKIVPMTESELILLIDRYKGKIYFEEARTMNINKCIKKSFVVIGKQGSTENGQGFIQNLWKEANLHFNEIKHLTKKDSDGNLSGMWGAMSDLSLSFKPWEENFTKGLYLAGAECSDDAQAPDGWTK